MDPSRAHDDEAAAVVSLPCPRCGDSDEPEPTCAVCRGEGIVLRRVPAARAGEPADRLRDVGEAWPPGEGDPA
jgi:hypothetical protein